MKALKEFGRCFARAFGNRLDANSTNPPGSRQTKSIQAIFESVRAVANAWKESARPSHARAGETRQLRHHSWAVVEPLEPKILFGDGWNRGPEDPIITDGPGPVCTPAVNLTPDDNQVGTSNSATPTAFSSAPVSYFSGAQIVESSDLTSTAFGTTFGIVRSWSGLNESSQLGNGWMIEDLPYLVLQHSQDMSYGVGGTISVVKGGQTQEAFDLPDNSNTISPERVAFSGGSGDPDSMTYSLSNGTVPGYFSLTDASGGITTFYDLPRVDDDDGTVPGGRLFVGAGYAQQAVAGTGGDAGYR